MYKLAFFLFFLAMSGSSMAAQQRQTSDDVPGRFIPGNYFAYKADFYIKKGDYAEALQMAMLASYWANKNAQYEVGIMYFTGSGVVRDKPRGAAWLRIATQESSHRAKDALERANGELNMEEQDRAHAIWLELIPEYSDEVTFARARNHFLAEKRNVTGSHVGFMSTLKIIAGGPDGDNYYSGDDYYAIQQRQFDQYIETNFGHGHVEVGPIESAPVR